MRSDQTARDDLIETMQFLHGRGWCDGTGGNFSVRLERDPLKLLMAPSGVDKGGVHAEQLIIVDANGSVIEGNGRASAETKLHLCIMSNVNAGAVLHTHSVAATVLSRIHDREGSIQLEGWEMLKGLEGIKSHETSLSLPVVANNQDMQQLAETVKPHLKRLTWGIVVAGHGLYAWGETLKQARRHVEIFEFLLSAHLHYRLMRKINSPTES